MTSSRRRTVHAGFTLIELLIYTGILVILVAVVGSTLLAFSRTYRGITAEQSVEQAAEGSLGRMVREIRNAKSVSIAASTFNTSPGVLALNTTNASGTAEVMTFSVTGGSLHLMIGNADIGPLMPSSARVSDLVFRLIAAGSSTAVKIETTFTSGTSTDFRSRSFYETAVLRGSYVR